MDRGMDEWNNYWTDITPYTIATYASEKDDFPTNFFNLKKESRTNRLTDIPSFKDAIAASKMIGMLFLMIVADCKYNKKKIYNLHSCLSIGHVKTPKKRRFPLIMLDPGPSRLHC